MPRLSRTGFLRLFTGAIEFKLCCAFRNECSGKGVASDEVMGQGTMGINVPRDVNDETEDYVEGCNGEDGKPVESLTREPEKGMELTRVEDVTKEVVNNGPVIGTKRKAFRIGGKENLNPSDQSKSSKQIKLASNLHKNVGHVQKKEGLRTFQSKGDLVKSGSVDQLDRHEGAVLLKKKAFKCHVHGCEKSYGRKAHLETHISIVHLNKENPIKCSFQGCGRSFRHRQELSNHLRSAHGAPKLACKEDGCSATFNSQSNLSVHLRQVHLKEKPVDCPEQHCNKKFTTKRDLKDHLRRAQEVKSEQVEVEESRDHHVKKARSKSRVKCDTCDPFPCECGDFENGPNYF